MAPRKPPHSRPETKGALARRQAALLRLSTSIAGAHDEAQVYQSVLDGLHDDDLGYSFLGLFLVDPETGDRVLQASAGWSGVSIGFRIPPGKGLSERPLLDGRLHYSAEVRRESTYVASNARGSEVDVPLRVDGDVVGVLVVESSEPNAFGEEDFEILTVAANHAGIAVARARLLARERSRADEQKALLDTIADLSSELELNKVLEAVLQRAVTLLGVTGGELATYDDATQELEVVASLNIGKDSAGTRIQLGEGAMGHVATTHEPILIPEYMKWLGRSEQYEDLTIHAVMAAPFLIGNRLVGAIATIHSDPARRFGDDDLRRLTMFAPQAAIAIENARLYTTAQQQTEYFKDVLLISPVAIVTLDVDHKIVSCNPAFEELFGYSGREVVGRDLDELISTAATHAEAVGYTQQVLGGGPIRAIGQRRRKDGSLVDVEVAGAPVIVDGELVGLIGLYHDVSELLQARRDAEAANEAKSSFLANMSHELRTPLNAILGYTQLLQRDRGITTEQRERLSGIERSGTHLLGLINEVLDLSKIEAGRLEVDLGPTSLRRLFRSVADMIRPRAESDGLAFELEVAPDLPAGILTDGPKLRQVLVNLLGNAVKFTDAGRVRMRVAMSLPDRLRIDVEDTGPGIAEERLSEIFDPFKQAEAGRTSGGTGLGLGISRRLVELLGGELKVESELGRGSCFTISLPVEEVATEELAETEADSLGADRELRLAAGQEITILVADDNRVNREILVDFLHGAGFRTVEATNGEEALARLREAGCPLVLMDIVMPVLDGMEATRALRADPELGETVVIAVSASVLGEAREHAIAAGFDDFISKPFKAVELFQKIERHLGVRYEEAEEPVRDDIAAAAAPDAPLTAEEASEFAARLRAAIAEGAFDLVEAAGGELRATGRPGWGERVVRLAREFDFDAVERLASELETAADENG